MERFVTSFVLFSKDLNFWNKESTRNSSITHMLSETMHQQQQILHLHTYTFFLVTHFDALLLIWKCCNTYRMDHIFLKIYLSNYKRIVLWSFFSSIRYIVIRYEIFFFWTQHLCRETMYDKNRITSQIWDETFLGLVTEDSLTAGFSSFDGKFIFSYTEDVPSKCSWCLK